MTNTCIMILDKNIRKKVFVMTKIISYLIEFLNRINKFIWKIIIFLSKFINVDDVKINNKPTDEKYKQFKVDEPALIEPFVEFEHKDYKQLIKDNNIKPIKRRKNLNIDIHCPCCGASKEYIYDNNGKHTQFECKVCSHIFSNNPNKSKDVILKCPHCQHTLSLRAKRSNYDVYVCKNENCQYYKRNLSNLKLSKTAMEQFKNNPTLFKLHYVYRKFNVDLPTLNKDYRDFVKQPVDLSKIYSSYYVLGLCLTYHVNYGLSYRQTASILKDIHEVSITYKTVENYCKSVSPTIQALLEFYPYELSDTIAADETYIKILNKTAYIFFYFDAIKKIVTSYRVFEKRDSLSSIKAAYSTLSKYDKLPDSLKVISDGNPIYNVAVQYWNQNGLPFELYQVIGLTNRDETSKKYRSQKQIIERFNRTLKYYYRPKCGFTSIDNANNYMVLFATYNNFLRPNKALDWNEPVKLPELQNINNMPNKWIELIKLATEYAKPYSN